MPDVKGEQHGIVDSHVLPLSVSAWQSSLAQAINETYSYTNSALFCAVVAGYYKDYAYRYIRIACQWLDGYVPSVHYPSSGIISTRIAGSLINGLARTITGEKLVYKIRGDKTDDAMDTLKFVSDWGDANNIKKAVKNGIAFSLALGTSLIKVNMRATSEEKKKIWWEAVRFDNAYYLADASNEVQEAEFMLRTYTDTRPNDGHNVQYYLSERRFYKTYQGSIKPYPDGTWGVAHKKGDRVAMVEYRVHRSTGQSLNNTMSTNRTSVGWSEIPEEIRKLIKRDYSAYRINEPQDLGLPTLGVEVLINDEGDISIPTGTNFGRGLVVPAIDDFIIYEVAESYAIRDMYNGKGTVYVPKSMSIGDMSVPKPTFKIPEKTEGDGAIKFDGTNLYNKSDKVYEDVPYQNPLSGLSDKYELIPGNNPEDQQVTIAQFELRPDQWQLIQENALKRIAVKWGMSPKILSSFLAQGAVQMTATQIDSEDDISIAFINQERATFKPVFNRLLETTLNYYGRPHNVDIEFASPSLINKDRILDRTLKKLEAGLIDIEEAIREINPDLDEETLQARINAAKLEQQRQMLMQMTEMNEMGEFGNNEDDLGGANLKGSTSPIQ